MGGATIGAGEQYIPPPSTVWGSGVWSKYIVTLHPTYYLHVTKNIPYTFTQWCI